MRVKLADWQFFEKDFPEIEWLEIWEMDHWMCGALLSRMAWSLRISFQFFWDCLFGEEAFFFRKGKFESNLGMRRYFFFFNWRKKDCLACICFFRHNQVVRREIKENKKWKRRNLIQTLLSNSLCFVCCHVVVEACAERTLTRTLSISSKEIAHLFSQVRVKISAW